MKRIANIKFFRMMLLVHMCLIVATTRAQDRTVNTLRNDVTIVSSVPSDSLSQLEGSGMEVFKIRSDKTYAFKVGSVVRVMCVNYKGRSRMKRAVLTDIRGDEFTFTPIDGKFEIVTYTPATLTNIEFVTPTAVVRGVVVNTVIVGALVVVTGFVLLESVVTGPSPRGRQDVGWIPFDNFHKHIRFKNSKNKTKWGVRAVYPTLARS